MTKQKILVIAGPTASGKSDLAMQLAEKYNGELVSADSLQVYKGLDIGTAKATAEERLRVPQHLLDLVPKTADFSVMDFVSAADCAIDDIAKRGRLPIIVGGTGFYVKALLGQQQFDSVLSKPEEVEQDAQKPLAELVDELQKTASPELLNRVDLQNKMRVVRALQICRHPSQKKTINREKYDALILAIDWPREQLYDRINRRVLMMKEMGLEDEAKQLYDAGGAKLQSGRGIGYKEFYPYFEGHESLSEVIAAIQQDSRRYAKRQLTYWRHQINGLQWISGEKRFQIADELLEKFLESRG